MDPKTAQILLGAAGSGGAAAALYVDDVFNIHTYKGNGALQTINNGLDMSGEGGMTMIKNLFDARDWVVTDTERGNHQIVETNTTDANQDDTDSGLVFTSTGFTVGKSGTSSPTYQATNNTFCSWSFRKAAKFFDVVTYTGNGTAGKTVSHSLGSIPGSIWVKRTDASADWAVYHRTIGNGFRLKLNTTDQPTQTSDAWNNTDPTSTQFTLGDGGRTNANGGTYVAYIFGHNEAAFGEDGDEVIIKCDGYTGNGSSNGPSINLGFEPQWIFLAKRNGSDNRLVLDVQRGLTSNGGYTHIQTINTTDAETFPGSGGVRIRQNGFDVDTSDSQLNGNGDTYAYIAIRRSHKPPETATDVFAVDTQTDTNPGFTSNFPVDVMLRRRDKNVVASEAADIYDRLTKSRVITNGTNAASASAATAFFLTTGWLNSSSTDANTIGWMFKRASGFFDVVDYDGTGSVQTVSHNLTVAPDLILVKRRDSSASWQVYNSVSGATKRLILNDTAGAEASSNRWNNTEPTSSVFTVATHSTVNASGGNYTAYLFSNLAGICKISSYTGTGNDINVDCGFTAGARFVIVKSLDTATANNWFLWDSLRGIVSGNDPYIYLNAIIAEQTSDDFIDPLNAGFTITAGAGSQLNTSGHTYLFIAIA